MATSPVRGPVAVAVVALVCDSRVLLVHRHPARDVLPGRWDLPGGHVEQGEQAWEAARREFREELGIEVCELTGLPLDSDLPGVGKHTFLATSWRGEPRNLAAGEHDALRWCSTDELMGLHLADPANIRDLVAHLASAAGTALRRPDELG